MEFVIVVTSARKNVDLEARMWMCSQLIFHEVYFSKIIVWNNIRRIWKWIHIFCRWVITNTFTIRVSIRFVTRVALIVVSVDFLLKWVNLYLRCEKWRQFIVLFNIAVSNFPLAILESSCFSMVKLAWRGFPFLIWQSIPWSVFVLESESSWLATFSNSFASRVYGNIFLSSSPSSSS